MIIIGISGKIGSGKDTAANYIVGEVLKYRDVIQESGMTADGRLMVNYVTKTGEKGLGEFDLSRQDIEFVNYLAQVVWPHVKIYHFADKLKYMCAELYGLDMEKLFGTQAQKSELCNIKYEQIINLLPKSSRISKAKTDYLTYREFLQLFADTLRSIDDDCFINYLSNQIMMEQCPVSIISDVRMLKEIEVIKQLGGKVIRLLKSTQDDKHRSETEIDNIDPKEIFDVVIDNRFCDIHEKNRVILSSLKEWGVIE